MSQYFPKPFRSFRRNIKVKVDLSIYATKDIENFPHVDTFDTLIFHKFCTKNKFS